MATLNTRKAIRGRGTDRANGTTNTAQVYGHTFNMISHNGHNHAHSISQSGQIKASPEVSYVPFPFIHSLISPDSVMCLWGCKISAYVEWTAWSYWQRVIAGGTGDNQTSWYSLSWWAMQQERESRWRRIKYLRHSASIMNFRRNLYSLSRFARGS